MLKFLDLFAGIGGFSLGLERAGMQCVGQVEIDPFCQRVLAHHWPAVKRIGDIHDVTAESFGAVELVCGGFPCQPFSCAGKRKGKEDDRYLWPEMLRVIAAYRPAWVVGENVTGIISMELDNVLSDLEAENYETESFIIPACAVDAPHRRDRVWIVARRRPADVDDAQSRRCRLRNSSHFGQDEGNVNAPSDASQVVAVSKCRRNRRGQQNRCTAPAQYETANRCEDVADTANPGIKNMCRRENTVFKAECFGENVANTQGLRRRERDSNTGGCGEGAGSAQERPRPSDYCRWLPEPDVGRVAHGIPGRVDRLRSLGNAVVPQVVEKIGKAIILTKVDKSEQRNVIA